MPVAESLILGAAIVNASAAVYNAAKNDGQILNGFNCGKKVETLTVGEATAGQEKRVLFAHGNGGGVAMATRPYRKR